MVHRNIFKKCWFPAILFHWRTNTCLRRKRGCSPHLHLQPPTQTKGTMPFLGHVWSWKCVCFETLEGFTELKLITVTREKAPTIKGEEGFEKIQSGYGYYCHIKKYLLYIDKKQLGSIKNSWEDINSPVCFPVCTVYIQFEGGYSQNWYHFPLAHLVLHRLNKQQQQQGSESNQVCSLSVQYPCHLTHHLAATSNPSWNEVIQTQLTLYLPPSRSLFNQPHHKTQMNHLLVFIP